MWDKDAYKLQKEGQIFRQEKEPKSKHKYNDVQNCQIPVVRFLVVQDSGVEVNTSSEGFPLIFIHFWNPS